MKKAPSYSEEIQVPDVDPQKLMFQVCYDIVLLVQKWQTQLEKLNQLSAQCNDEPASIHLFETLEQLQLIRERWSQKIGFRADLIRAQRKASEKEVKPVKMTRAQKRGLAKFWGWGPPNGNDLR